MNNQSIIDIVGILFLNSYKKPEQVLVRKREITINKKAKNIEKMPMYDTIGCRVGNDIEKNEPNFKNTAYDSLRPKIKVALKSPYMLKKFSTYKNCNRKVPLRTTTFIPSNPIPDLDSYKSYDYNLVEIHDLPHDPEDKSFDGMIVSGSLIFVSNLYPDGKLTDYINNNILSETPNPFDRIKEKFIS